MESALVDDCRLDVCPMLDESTEDMLVVVGGSTVGYCGGVRMTGAADDEAAAAVAAGALR